MIAQITHLEDKILFNTPILFIIFNRPDTTAKVFDSIRNVRPTQLFIAADGPRYPLKDEYELCLQTRAIIEQIDWPCDVKTFFRDANFGVGLGVVQSINWFFEHVEAGIILEDDCVPSLDFFSYCQGMLALYKHDPTVMMVAGTNNLMGQYAHMQGHYKSHFYSIWGWATWRRAWNLYDFEMTGWRANITEQDLLKFFNNPHIVEKWCSIFDSIIEHRLQTWDAQWVFACIRHRASSIVSPFNMISNIGFYGAHANGNRSLFHEMPIQHYEIKKVLENLLSVDHANQFDLETYKINNFLYHDSYWLKIGRSIKKTLKQSWRMLVG